jgi:hypothetical protein
LDGGQAEGNPQLSAGGRHHDSEDMRSAQP